MCTSSHGSNDFATHNKDSDITTMTFLDVFLDQHSIRCFQHLPGNFAGLSLGMRKEYSTTLSPFRNLDHARYTTHLTNRSLYIAPISNQCCCWDGDVICREDLSCMQLVSTVVDPVAAVCNISPHSLKLTSNGNTVFGN